MLRQTYALPVDGFRVLVGLLSFAYFLSLLWQVSDFSSPNGLIDHVLLRRIFWFTKLSLFFPGMTDSFFYAVFTLGCLGSAAIVLGYRVKLCAAVLYLIAVSSYRWNFVVMYVDDSIMHLMLFWLLLLPVGKTLNLPEALREGRRCWARWMRTVVPGTAVYCLLGNLCLLYLVSGLWKLESPLWRQGFALYATVRLPIGWFPNFWTPQHLPLLAAGTYATMVIEPLLPVALFQRRGHPLKWLGLVALLLLHLGIIATMRIPFANIACIAGAVLFFRDEIMHALLRRTRTVVQLASALRADAAGRVAVALLVVLSIAMTRRLPVIGVGSHPAYAVLWFAGIAQDYQLFNWIDKKNLYGENRVLSIANGPLGEPVDPRVMFPTSLRGALLQAYLHDVRWIKIPDEDQPALKESILSRLAQRYCDWKSNDSVMVLADTQRIEPGNAALDHPETKFLMEFQCHDGRAVLCRTMVNLERSQDCRWPPWGPKR
ncbi:MAG TPA: hypothetical protein VL403_11650 [Candidatus Kryptonia bacterium]|nr:hypothetical protein [Candidatus Kryptonia bacterium]